MQENTCPSRANTVYHSVANSRAASRHVSAVAKQTRENLRGSQRDELTEEGVGNQIHNRRVVDAGSTYEWDSKMRKLDKGGNNGSRHDPKNNQEIINQGGRVNVGENVGENISLSMGRVSERAVLEDEGAEMIDNFDDAIDDSRPYSSISHNMSITARDTCPTYEWYEGARGVHTPFQPGPSVSNKRQCLLQNGSNSERLKPPRTSVKMSNRSSTPYCKDIGRPETFADIANHEKSENQDLISTADFGIPQDSEHANAHLLPDRPKCDVNERPAAWLKPRIDVEANVSSAVSGEGRNRGNPEEKRGSKNLKTLKKNARQKRNSSCEVGRYASSSEENYDNITHLKRTRQFPPNQSESLQPTRNNEFEDELCYVGEDIQANQLTFEHSEGPSQASKAEECSEEFLQHYDRGYNLHDNESERYNPSSDIAYNHIDMDHNEEDYSQYERSLTESQNHTASSTTGFNFTFGRYAAQSVVRKNKVDISNLMYINDVHDTGDNAVGMYDPADNQSRHSAPSYRAARLDRDEVLSPGREDMLASRDNRTLEANVLNTEDNNRLHSSVEENIHSGNIFPNKSNEKHLLPVFRVFEEQTSAVSQITLESTIPVDESIGSDDSLDGVGEEAKTGEKSAPKKSSKNTDSDSGIHYPVHHSDSSRASSYLPHTRSDVSDPPGDITNARAPNITVQETNWPFALQPQKLSQNSGKSPRSPVAAEGKETRRSVFSALCRNAEKLRNLYKRESYGDTKCIQKVQQKNVSGSRQVLEHKTAQSAHREIDRKENIRRGSKTGTLQVEEFFSQNARQDGNAASHPEMIPMREMRGSVLDQNEFTDTYEVEHETMMERGSIQYIEHNDPYIVRVREEFQHSRAPQQRNSAAVDGSIPIVLKYEANPQDIQNAAKNYVGVNNLPNFKATSNQDAQGGLYRVDNQRGNMERGISGREGFDAGSVNREDNKGSPERGRRKTAPGGTTKRLSWFDKGEIYTQQNYYRKRSNIYVPSFCTVRCSLYLFFLVVCYAGIIATGVSIGIYANEIAGLIVLGILPSLLILGCFVNLYRNHVYISQVVYTVIDSICWIIPLILIRLGYAYCIASLYLSYPEMPHTAMGRDNATYGVDSDDIYDPSETGPAVDTSASSSLDEKSILVIIFEAFVIAGVLEETLKYLVVRRVLWKDYVCDVRSLIVYSLAGGVAFAIVENVAYLFESMTSLQSIHTVDVSISASSFPLPASQNTSSFSLPAENPTNLLSNITRVLSSLLVIPNEVTNIFNQTFSLDGYKLSSDPERSGLDGIYPELGKILHSMGLSRSYSLVSDSIRPLGGGGGISASSISASYRNLEDAGDAMVDNVLSEFPSYITLGIFRSIFTIPMHCLTSLVIGCQMGKMKFLNRSNLCVLCSCYFFKNSYICYEYMKTVPIAILIHGLFNTTLRLSVKLDIIIVPLILISIILLLGAAYVRVFIVQFKHLPHVEIKGLLNAGRTELPSFCIGSLFKKGPKSLCRDYFALPEYVIRNNAVGSNGAEDTADLERNISPLLRKPQSRKDERPAKKNMLQKTNVVYDYTNYAKPYWNLRSKSEPTIIFQKPEERRQEFLKRHQNKLKTGFSALVWDDGPKYSSQQLDNHLQNFYNTRVDKSYSGDNSPNSQSFERANYATNRSGLYATDKSEERNAKSMSPRKDNRRGETNEDVLQDRRLDPKQRRVFDAEDNIREQKPHERRGLVSNKNEQRKKKDGAKEEVRKDGANKEAKKDGPKTEQRPNILDTDQLLAHVNDILVAGNGGRKGREKDKKAIRAGDVKEEKCSSPKFQNVRRHSAIPLFLETGQAVFLESSQHPNSTNPAEGYATTSEGRRSSSLDRPLTSSHSQSRKEGDLRSPHHGSDLFSSSRGEQAPAVGFDGEARETVGKSDGNNLGNLMKAASPTFAGNAYRKDVKVKPSHKQARFNSANIYISNNMSANTTLSQDRSVRNTHNHTTHTFNLSTIVDARNVRGKVNQFFVIACPYCLEEMLLAPYIYKRTTYVICSFCSSYVTLISAFKNSDT